ncbi:MAG: host attachment protein [Sphingomonadaceae bacterium]
MLPPQALGCMRVALRDTLADTVIAEIPADLVKMPVERIGAYIAEHLQS